MHHCGAPGCPGHFRRSEKCPDPELWEKYPFEAYCFRGLDQKSERSIESRREKPDFWKVYAPRPVHGENIASSRRALDNEEQKIESHFVQYGHIGPRRETEKDVLPKIIIIVNFCYSDKKCLDHLQKVIKISSWI